MEERRVLEMKFKEIIIPFLIALGILGLAFGVTYLVRALS